MSEINYDYLTHAILDTLDENVSVDIDTILKSAEIVWDGTAVQVKSSEFTMIFNIISYELEDYRGYDA